LNKLKAKGLGFSKPASPQKWLRRASLDIRGLPASEQELALFLQQLQNNSEKAYESMVDELLESSHYGERMAIDWLDVSRYADSHGFNNDSTRSMWRWRDWVIDAFNQNMPYDQFITEQLAGDLLENPTLNQLIATGFNRNHVINSEGGIIDEEYRVEYVADRVRTLGMAWMGLTTECARCHDHKYDPLTQKDYYSLFAFFNQVPEAGEDGRIANASPLIMAPTHDQKDEMERLKKSYLQQLQVKAEVVQNFKWSDTVFQQIDQIVRSANLEIGPIFQVDADREEKAFKLTSSLNQIIAGISGNAFRLDAQCNFAEIAKSKLKSVKDNPTFTISFWIKPDMKNEDDVPLLSSKAHHLKPAARGFGKGMELRLSGGEIKFMLSGREYGESNEVVSVGANIQSGQWHHISVVYFGKDNKDQRVLASKVRLYVDGVLMNFNIIKEGLLNNMGINDDMIRVGWDSKNDSKRYCGLIDEIQYFDKALSYSNVRRGFQVQAGGYLKSIGKVNGLSKREKQWAYDILRLDGEGEELTKIEQIKEQMFALEQQIPTTMVMQDQGAVRPTALLVRGMYDHPGERVEPDVPSFLSPWPQAAPRNRLGLAMWLTDKNNPLTARVVVNRFWQQVFGVGLVKTSEDFGYQSEWPSHLELLNHLAYNFISSGWNVKQLLKAMVLSRTYRQDSSREFNPKWQDPENRLLARGPRFRLPAELIRDQALAISGLLTQKIGGASVFPYQPENFYKGIVVEADYPGTKWIQSQDSDLYRKSLYTFWKRTIVNPTMTSLDAPDREVCMVKRSITNTPLQALTLMNDPTFVEASKKLAERILLDQTSLDQKMHKAFQCCTGRAPELKEKQVLLKLYRQAKVEFEAKPDFAKELLAHGHAPVNSSLDEIDLAAMTMMCSTLLNLDETITKD